MPAALALIARIDRLLSQLILAPLVLSPGLVARPIRHLKFVLKSITDRLFICRLLLKPGADRLISAEAPGIALQFKGGLYRLFNAAARVNGIEQFCKHIFWFHLLVKII
jgi:hypothetical protein